MGIWLNMELLVGFGGRVAVRVRKSHKTLLIHLGEHVEIVIVLLVYVIQELRFV